MTRRSLTAATVALLAAASAAACGSGGQSTQGDGAGTDELTVFAAASLQQTFTALGEDFERAHPGTEVTFAFAGSADLVAQLRQGADADVFASADTITMARAIGDSLTASKPVPFAANTLQIAVPPGNPAGIATLQDLARPGVAVVVCAPVVPCGAAAARVERAAGVDFRPVSEEQSVADVLGKVVTGEADAGLVYRTDVQKAGGTLEGIAFPESSAAVNVYPIARLRSSDDPALADSFLALVTGPRGQQTLARAGFGQAPPTAR